MAETFKINEIDYDCEFKLTNSDDQEVNFTKSAIRGMEISDNIFDPFIGGTIAIANPYDFVENEYLMRGDGRDKFKIMFGPTDQPDNKFEHIFSIVDDSNYANPNVRSENIKNFVIYDEDSIKFMDEVPYGKTFSGNVGDIIRDIFKELLGEERVDEDNWESGDFNISYIPPVHFRYMDLLHYMMRMFYAKDGELNVKGIISHDRETDKYRFDLISKIFKDNKKKTEEAFGMGDLTDKLSFDNPNNPPPDAPTGEYIGPLKNLGYSTPNYGWNNNYFVNSLVHGYDPILGIQKIRKLSIEDLREKWKSKFVDVFKSKQGKVKPFLVQNKTSKKKFRQYKFPYNVEDGVKIVESEIHNALTFYNLQCAFSNLGDVRRQSGKFIDIYKTKEQELKSDEKILGRWFVTEIKHKFVGDLYANEILCTKTYVGPKSEIDKNAS